MYLSCKSHIGVKYPGHSDQMFVSVNTNVILLDNSLTIGFLTNSVAYLIKDRQDCWHFATDVYMWALASSPRAAL